MTKIQIRQIKEYQERIVFKDSPTLIDRFFFGFESVIYIILSYLAGFKFCQTHNFMYLFALFLILLLRFNMTKIKEKTKEILI
jgi:hypothetical protein